MNAWLEANPAAGVDEQMAVARQIVDSIDNRFGEMIQDNIFWHTLAKQTAAIGMLSYSWNLGAVRELREALPSQSARSARARDIASKEYDPRVAYVVAFPMVIAAMNAIYQYMKTGKPPQSAQDLMAAQYWRRGAGFRRPRPGAGARHPPGYRKTCLAGTGHAAECNAARRGYGTIGQEVYNKLNPLMRMGADAAAQKELA